MLFNLIDLISFISDRTNIFHLGHYYYALIIMIVVVAIFILFMIRFLNPFKRCIDNRPRVPQLLGFASLILMRTVIITQQDDISKSSMFVVFVHSMVKDYFYFAIVFSLLIKFFNYWIRIIYKIEHMFYQRNIERWI